ncbi:MAG: cytochrome c biogenesis protein ResB [Phycisphaeraceae bacterium]
MSDRLKILVTPLASLKLTVALFVAAMFLIFTGTLAQAEDGTWVIVDRYFRSAVAWIDLRLLVPWDVTWLNVSVPFPGGFVIGGLLLLNLVAAHTLRFKLSRRRVGVLVIHFGLILLLLSEMATALLAEEGRMTIPEGASSNYTEDIRSAELYVIDRSDSQYDQVTVVPEGMLEREGVVDHAQLPFEVRVEQWMVNSRLFTLEGEGEPRTRATRGRGRRVIAEAAAPAAGVDSEVNLPSAYVTLVRDGETLGTWLLSLWLEAPQQVEVEGKTYDIGLRFERTYKPYTMHLIDFRHDRFTGTEKPRNFSSRVRLMDPSQNEDREVLIYMNHPLHYNGETFYQSAYLPNDSGTVLQVVNNPAWWVPYASCVLVGGGMLLHFGQHLVRFMRSTAR